MYKELLPKFILYTTLSLAQLVPTHAGYWGVSDTEYLKKARELSARKSKYSIEAKEQYDFLACKKFQSADRDYDYHLRCENGQSIENQDFSKLQSTMYSIETRIFKDNILEELKELTVQQLVKSQEQINFTQACLRESKTSVQTTKCALVVQAMVRSVKFQLPKLRATMSMMDAPTHQTYKREKKYHKKRIQHRVSSKQIPPLTKNEENKIEAEVKVLRHHLEQRWFAQQFPKNKCVRKIGPTSFAFIQNKLGLGKHQCASYQKSSLQKHVKNAIKETRESYKKNYIKQIDANPLLVHLRLTGEESDLKIKEEIARTIEKMANSTRESLEKVNRTKNDDLLSLIDNDFIVENYLKSKGPTNALCDVAQDLRDSRDFEEIKEDLLLAGGALIGGGLCFFTAGLGCLVSVAVLAEGTNLIVSQSRLNGETLAFESGLTTAAGYEDRKFDRDLTLVLAPLAIVGEGIGHGIKIGRKLTSMAPSGNAIDTDFRGLYFKHKLRTDIPPPPKVGLTKTQLIDDYENFILASPRLNARWISSAKNESAAFYLDIENSALKRLNDGLGDKSLVTALTNLHKETLSRNINKLLQKYPQVDIEVYSDFKSVRYAFKPKDMPKTLRESLQADLTKAYAQTNKEFSKIAKTIDGIPASENPSGWFQAGSSTSADQAGLASKKARDLPLSQNRITDFGEIEYLVKHNVKSVAKYTNKLARNHPLTNGGLTEIISNTGKRTLSLPLFELLRKVKPIPQEKVNKLIRKQEKSYAKAMTNTQASELLKGEALSKQIKTRFGVELTTNESLELLDYASTLDSLTPGLWVSKRVSANLNEANLGGMSGDITGMGARNVRQVALDLANTRGDSSIEVIKAIRKGEENVTAQFFKIKDNFKRTVNRVMKKRGIKVSDPCSGDDCVMIPDKELSHSDQRALVKEFISQDYPAQYRLSFIPKNVTSRDRTNLAVHGELIEKELRKLVSGIGSNKITMEKLGHITIATKMPSGINGGDVGILIGLGKGSQLNSRELQTIKDALRRAVSQTNEALRQESPNVIYTYQAGSIDLIR